MRRRRGRDGGRPHRPGVLIGMPALPLGHSWLDALRRSGEGDLLWQLGHSREGGNWVDRSVATGLSRRRRGYQITHARGL